MPRPNKAVNAIASVFEFTRVVVRVIVVISNLLYRHSRRRLLRSRKAGFLTCGSLRTVCLPNVSTSGVVDGRSPHTVAGAVVVSGPFWVVPVHIPI